MRRGRESKVEVSRDCMSLSLSAKKAVGCGCGCRPAGLIVCGHKTWRGHKMAGCVGM